MVTPIQSPHVVIIGGGPTSLIYANEMAHLGHRVVIFEGRDAYTRTHLLRIRPGSFNGISPDSPLKEIVDELRKNPHIETQVLEKKLLTIAEKSGVEIRRAYVRDPQLLSKMPEFKDTKIFIGADSRWSKVREKIFGDQLRFQEELAYVTQIKYKVKGQGKALNWLRYGYATQKLMQAPALEFVGKEKDGETSITVQITIDHATFKKMENASTGNAYQWETQKDSIDPAIQKCVEIWLNTKEKIVGEQPVKDTIMISVIPLASYSSQTIVKVDATTEKLWALVGDAATGLPLMEGLNHGTSCAIRLASASHQYLTRQHENSLYIKGSLGGDAIHGQVPPVFKAYAAYVRNYSIWESYVAKFKSFFITLYGWWIYISSLVPWQSNKWNADDARVLRSVHLKKDLD